MFEISPRPAEQPTLEGEYVKLIDAAIEANVADRLQARITREQHGPATAPRPAAVFGLNAIRAAKEVNV
jgi:hypothetical protein